MRRASRKRYLNDSMPQYDSAIIGGGHNGLVTAAYLARAGRKVLVLERRELVGGCAVTEEIWPGYRVSTGAYLTSLLQERIVRELELERFGYQRRRQGPRVLLRLSRRPPSLHVAGSREDAGRNREILAARCRSVSEVRSASGTSRSGRGVAAAHHAPAIPAARHRRFHRIPEARRAAARPVARKKSSALVKIFTQSAADFLDEWFESRADQSHARHRRRDRRERRPALARHGLHSAASLHGRRGRPSRIVGIRARRHGRGLRSHRRFGARARARRSASTRRSSKVLVRDGRARGVVLETAKRSQRDDRGSQSRSRSDVSQADRPSAISTAGFRRRRSGTSASKAPRSR